MDDPGEFTRIVTLILTRYYRQLGRPAPTGQFPEFARRLAQLVAERGLPRPLRDDECGTPGGMSEEVCSPLVTRIVPGGGDAALAEAARQFVKACFYPEFRNCRDSFREVARDGSCRRQQLERVRGRISGSHCVDCPHWTALDEPGHVAYLRQEWRGDARELAGHREAFLPEDFRALRRWLHRAART